MTQHQKAVNALVDASMYYVLHDKIPNARMSVPYRQIPALFRRAIKEGRGDGEERAILECWLALGGTALEPTPAQREFYESLALSLDSHEHIRIKYDPQNVTIQ
jgi:hypothetical protein